MLVFDNNPGLLSHTGYLYQYSLPAETVSHIWFPRTLSDLSLPVETCTSSRVSPCDSASCQDFQQEAVKRTVSTGGHFSWTVVLEGSKRSRASSAEAKFI